ncbi:hypothetical protein BCR33DRAFT_713331 [Rhizoclosmatium globosum]|uniref:Uncharacterized protein n=1 Tax=Rhizoclosmatium globosum TaxID=329046 RepID=A0A1Y2CU62_9FUNG|nr:hypothetical protein BCR33DRAFT_713331 [Rhizoclosmatium globosum]|eukprot:ORY50563.1 hypothetical protein BCR33DRAFT_713331 [Rhizoclosmatium globosum]
MHSANNLLTNIKIGFLGLLYIPVIIYEDLLNQIQHKAATSIALVLYILAAIGFFVPLALSSPPSYTYVQTYLVLFVCFVFFPMILGGIRVAFSNNAAGLQTDLVCPIRKPKALELLAAGLKCALESGFPLDFMDPTFLVDFGFFAGVTQYSNVFRVVFWICVFWVFIARKYTSALTKKLGVTHWFVIWWSPTISYDCPFYILVCELMISVFRCVDVEGSEGTLQQLGDLTPQIICWQGEHLICVIIAFASMIAYFPSGCSMCSAKDMITYEESDLRFVPAYVKFSQMIKGVCICSMVLFAKTPVVAYSIATITMVIMFATTVRFWPAAAFGLNAVKLFTYGSSVYLYIFLAVTIYNPHLSIGAASSLMSTGIILVAIITFSYEFYVAQKRMRATEKNLWDILEAFSPSPTSQPKKLEILRPVEMYSLYLLSDNVEQFRPAFLMLPEVEAKISSLDSERRQQTHDRPRKHPAHQTMKEALKITMQSFERLLMVGKGEVATFDSSRI